MASTSVRSVSKPVFVKRPRVDGEVLVSQSLARTVAMGWVVRYLEAEIVRVVVLGLVWEDMVGDLVGRGCEVVWRAMGIRVGLMR